MSEGSLKLTPEEYFQEFLEAIKTRSIRNGDFSNTDFGLDKINWSEYEIGIWERFHEINPKSIDDAEPILREALNMLNDGHSYYIGDPSEFEKTMRQNFQKSGQGSHPTPSGEIIEHTAYLNIPCCTLQNLEDRQHFSTQIQDLIKSLDAEKPHGWIIDLRDNFGGDSHSMLAGLGPLLGNGIHSHFASPNGPMTKCWHEDGQSGTEFNRERLVHGSVEGEPYTLQNASNPIGVLIGSRTNSSGEQVAIAFSPDCKLYGECSAGSTTANACGIPVEGDVRMIAIASCIMADKNGKLFGKKIKPDVEFSSQDTHDNPSDDPLVKFVARELKDAPPRKIITDSAKDLDSLNDQNPKSSIA